MPITDRRATFFLIKFVIWHNQKSYGDKSQPILCWSNLIWTKSWTYKLKNIHLILSFFWMLLYWSVDIFKTNNNSNASLDQILGDLHIWQTEIVYGKHMLNTCSLLKHNIRECMVHVLGLHVKDKKKLKGEGIWYRATTARECRDWLHQVGETHSSWSFFFFKLSGMHKISQTSVTYMERDSLAYISFL